MKIGKRLPIEEHLSLNIEKSTGKWISKVSIYDTAKYLGIIRHYKKYLCRLGEQEKPKKLGPILSLAVRNGREVDLFRLCLRGIFTPLILKIFEIKRTGFRTLLVSFLEKLNRSRLDSIKENDSIGVELAKKGSRQDVFIGSFDEMPSCWESKFSIIYFNSLDHSYDPYVTAKEIKRVANEEAYLIIAFPKEQEPSIYDPVADVGISDLKELFGGKLIYCQEHGSKWNYSEYIIKL